MSDRTQISPNVHEQLARRLLDLKPGMMYQICLIIPNDGRPPYWSILTQSKLENYRQPQPNMVK